MSDLVTEPVRRIQRVRHELQRRELEVTRVETLSPNFVAVTLRGESLSSFRSDSFDDHVKLFFDQGAKRDYTPRRFDAARQELTIEFALHGEGVASDWARQATVGQRLSVGGPRGSMIIPFDYDWHLLIGDDSALPAVHRRIEELPPHARVVALLQVSDAADRRAFPEQVQVQWVASREELHAAVTALVLPEGEGFAWAAGESTAMTALRPVLVAKGLSKDVLKVSAYWKLGAEAFHESLGDPGAATVKQS